MARGPASFFLGAFLSPGVICGRSSCAAPDAAKAITYANPQSNSERPCRIVKNLLLAGLAVARCPGFDAAVSGDMCMKVNDKAPDFALQDEDGKEIALKDLRGKTVVLYFYPRADTPGCTIEACKFR